MTAKFRSVPAASLSPSELVPWPYWGPALMGASMAAWALVLAAAKLLAALV